MSGQVEATWVPDEQRFQAEALRGVRRMHFLTQEALARELGVTVRTIVRWEAGVSEPSFRSVRKLAGFFGVEPKDFYGNHDDDKVAA